ncbi:unnamed protein product, partial [Allacma fusca]
TSNCTYRLVAETHTFIMRWFLFSVAVGISSVYFAFAFTMEVVPRLPEVTREERMFSFFSSKNSNSDETCTSGTSTGICTSSTKCKGKGGTTFSGTSCSNSKVCCQIVLKCNTTDPCIIKNSGTVVQDAAVPPPYRRTYRYIKPKGVCQLRLDFDVFNLAAPDVRKDCSEDVFQVAGLPICGMNGRQHVYVDYEESSRIDATIRIRSTVAKYSIRNTYIPCNSEKLAPKGCRQYFEDPEGRVTSFNYIVGEPNNLQTNNQEYSVCIKAGDGLSKIQWKQCAGEPFFISGGGLSIGPLESPECKKDWVQIYGLDRYCGRGFNDQTSIAKPFLLNVHFDVAEGFGVSLPTDPSQCNGQTITDPYTGGTLYTIVIAINWCSLCFKCK